MQRISTTLSLLVVAAAAALALPSAASAHGCTTSAGVLQQRGAITGTPNADTIDCTGVGHGHHIVGGAGADTVRGSRTAPDLLQGGPGNDVLLGGGGLDIAGGGAGFDVCRAFIVVNCETRALPSGDTDGDGVPDASDTDDDNDGQADTAEVTCGSDPLDPNSRCEECDGADNDLDGQTDEGFTDTNADGEADCVDADDDGDGLTDLDEGTQGTDPLDVDSDDDGLSDGDEVNVHGTNPLSADTDDDGLSDYDEVVTHGTDPANPDTDGDLWFDSDEVNCGSDPFDPLSDPMSTPCAGGGGEE
jgi:hypothetical protein